jgi:hypothetical protein
MDEDTIKKAGVGPLKSLLEQISGHNITETVLLLLERGVGALASFYVSVGIPNILYAWGARAHTWFRAMIGTLIKLRYS